MTDLSALRERLEGATGPDRDLDAAVAVALDGFFELPPRWADDAVVSYGYIDAGGSRVSPGYGGAQLVPFYTASVDRALALVESKLPGINTQVVQHSNGRGSCEMWNWAANRFEQLRERNRENGHPVLHQNVGAATPPLAILKALLSALQEAEAGREG